MVAPGVLVTANWLPRFANVAWRDMTLGVVALGFAIFRVAVEYLPVFECGEMAAHDHMAGKAPGTCAGVWRTRRDRLLRRP